MSVSPHDPVYDWLAYHARTSPDRRALVDMATGRSFSYGEFNDRATRLATGLRDSYDVARGDRVATLAHNSSDMFEVLFACWKLGAIFTPLNWRLHARELAQVLEHASPVVIVCDDALRSSIVESSIAVLARGDDANVGYERLIADSGTHVVMPPDLTYDDVHSILYTSGTTGKPKGAIYTHRMAMNTVLSSATHGGLDRNSHTLVFAPLFHAAPLYAGGVPLFHFGGTVFVMPGWDASACLKYICDPHMGITHFNGVPTNFITMQELPEFETAAFPTVRMFGIGSAPISLDLLERWQAKGALLTQSYGMTEAFSVTLTSLDTTEARSQVGTAGRPMLHVELRVASADGAEKPTGEVGEIHVRGPGVIPGYYREPELSKAAFFADGWFRTGDAGRINADGTLTVVDRIKDMFISGGENIYPSEIEDVLAKLDAVSQVAVIGIPHAKWGEAGLALIVLRPGSQMCEAEALEACGNSLARYKIPKRVLFIESLPLSPQGKVLKRELRGTYQRQSESLFENR
ncbi:MAG: fatty-acyl-CoA synthase [Halieaceae bacterium]